MVGSDGPGDKLFRLINPEEFAHLQNIPLGLPQSELDGGSASPVRDTQSTVSMGADASSAAGFRGRMGSMEADRRSMMSGDRSSLALSAASTGGRSGGYFMFPQTTMDKGVVPQGHDGDKLGKV